jgi:F-type H+-transporting ATPase subunit alpha
MKFKADEIASVIQQEIEQYESRIDVRETGRVLEVGDGIARLDGLSRRDGRRDSCSSRAGFWAWS